MLRLKRICLSLLCLLIANCSLAETDLLKRKDVQKFISTMSRDYGFSTSQLNSIFKQVKLQPQIIESMEKPYEKKNWDVYKALFLTDKRLQEGLQFWQANREILSRAEKKYKVPAPLIVAILGVETNYGKSQGNYRVIDALSTLAFDYPKRSPYFTKELREFFLLCRELKRSPFDYYGSYAGAIGMPQFMPSSYRYYAVDFTGNGERDLVNNNADVIGSIANYFHLHGWKVKDTVAQQATLKGKGYQHIELNTKYAKYRVKQLAKNGVSPASSSWRRPSHAGLIEFITAKGNEYWLAYPNFYVITRYNSSPQYALAVYLLAQQLQNQWAKNHWGWQKSYV